ncbi:hypothetical protein GJ496_005560 [Pomphorhynchus laevis]|nr:hypothetical protein GJ496_005560 [Pomphorhynchus laevis]
MCARSCLKSLLILVNFAFVVIGAVLIGAYFVFKNGDYLKVLEILSITDSSIASTITDNKNKLLLIFLVSGVFILFVSCIGFLGGCFNSKILLYLYTAIVVTLTVGELVVYILLNTNKESFKTQIRSYLTQLLNTFNSNSLNVISSFRTVHETFNCCGVNGRSDFSSNSQLSGTCTNNVTEGCFAVISNLIDTHIQKIGIGGAGLMIVQIVAIVASVSVGCN